MKFTSVSSTAAFAQFSVQRLGHLAQNAPLSAPVSIPSRSRFALHRPWAG
jgi:hypothetical protein